jgi:hypothetical protein
MPSLLGNPRGGPDLYRLRESRPAIWRLRNFLASISLGPWDQSPCFAGYSFRQASMSRVPWHQFQDRQPQAHLVVGALAQAEGPVGGDELNAVQKLLNWLVRQQKLVGDYASTVVRDTGRPEVYFAFVEEADARKFGDAVQAETTDTYPGWVSQRAFDLPSSKLASLEALLPAPRDNPRQRIADGSQLARRVRRGPWTPHQTLQRGMIGRMPPRNPPPTLEQAVPNKRSDRYVVEIRDAAGTSLLLTSADWTAKERDLGYRTSRQQAASPHGLILAAGQKKRRSTGPLLVTSKSGRRPIASRHGCTRPHCAYSLIAPMPKRTAVDRRARFRS